MKNLLPTLSIFTVIGLATAATHAADPTPAAPAAKAAPPAAPAAPAAPAKAPPPAAELPPGVVGPPTTAWKDMTKEQKGKFMKEVVVPKMKPAFQAFDGEEFKKFDCATCHGSKGKARGFKMPSPQIYALPDSKEGFEALMKKKPKWIEFMGMTVKPQMAALLGQPEFNPEKPEAGGFGCQNCHTSKKKP
jgi:hypothetical protein